MAKKKVNPLDAFAKKDIPSTSKKKSTKIAATTSNAVRNAVDTIIDDKAEIKRLAIELAENEQLIIGEVAPQQEDQAREGNFSKSFYVEGNTGNLTCTWSDKFSVPKDSKIHAAIKKLLGVTLFGKWFETKRTVTLNADVQDDEKLLNKLIKVITDAGYEVPDVFDIKDVLIAKKDLDREQFSLTKSKLSIFRTLVTQAKAALK